MPAATKRRPRRDEPDYIDKRTRSGRRLKSLVATFTAELGGSLSPADAELVKTAAGLSYTLEQMQADVAKGNTANAGDMVRVASEARRILAQLRRTAEQKKPAGPDLLREYLVNKAAVAAGASGAADPA